jgi:hypothetical protein
VPLGLQDFLKEKVYMTITAFREVTKGAAGCNFEQFKTVMVKLSKDTSISEKEIAEFWSKYNMNGVFYYAE